MQFYLNQHFNTIFFYLILQALSIHYSEIHIDFFIHIRFKKQRIRLITPQM